MTVPNPANPKADVTPASANAGDSVSANVKWRMGDWQFESQISATTVPARLSSLLPLLHEITNQVVEAAVRDLDHEGKTLSCQAGCGACCRQLVPLAEVDARDIARVIDAMPEPRQTEIRARFAATRDKLIAAGMWQQLENRHAWSDEEAKAVGMDYYRLGIPCPFLENESCSIYPDRPSVCREYLVTSPASHCAAPTGKTIDLVPVPKTWTAMCLFDERPPGSRFLRWVPLTMAPFWAESQPPEPVAGKGTELVERLFKHLAEVGRPIPTG